MIKAYISLLVVLLFSIHSYSQLKVIGASCENKKNPLGVQANNIRFSWEFESTENNQYQTAYQLMIASSQQQLESGNYDVYNSSMVKSSSNILVKYSGKPLQTAHTYYWKVRAWDKNNKPSAWSSPQSFTTALNTNDWSNAQWIAYETFPDSMKIVPGAETVKGLGNKGMG